LPFGARGADWYELEAVDEVPGPANFADRPGARALRAGV